MDFRKRRKAFIERNLETARKAHKAGVKFAMGSDAIYTMFGENTRELGWFVKAGMTPEQALRTATTNAAELLGHPTELGAVAPGYFADLVAVEGDPLSNIDVAIKNVRWVMKSGQVVVDKTSRPHRLASQINVAGCPILAGLVYARVGLGLLLLFLSASRFRIADYCSLLSPTDCCRLCPITGVRAGPGNSAGTMRAGPSGKPLGDFALP